MELQYLLYKADGTYDLTFFFINKYDISYNILPRIKTKCSSETYKQMMEEVRMKAEEAVHKKREAKDSEDDTEEVSVKNIKYFYINLLFPLRI